MKISLLIPIGLICIVTAANAKPPIDLQSKLDAFTKGSGAGASVAWVDSDGAAFFQSGTFSANDPRPITPDTQFELGSISKVFTALLLAESERLGKVARLDPAAKYLLPPADPSQPALAKITLLSLTTHTSGLPRMPSNMVGDPKNPNPYGGYDDTELVAALRADGPSAPVGRNVVYSNFGAAVLGEALAAAWGTSYAVALQEHVLLPLGLKATTLGLTGSPPLLDLAPSHAAGQIVPTWTYKAFAPAAGLRSSARDMAIFLADCLGKEGSPLHASFEATLRPQFPSEATGGHVGMGWQLSDNAEAPLAWHNGATSGSRAFVGFSPKTGAGIAILANFQVGPEKLGFELLGASLPHPQSVAVKNAADYTGGYPLSSAFAIEITEANGTLHAQGTGQPQLLLREIAPDRFSVVDVAAEITFERDASGKVSALVLHQNGADQRALRGELPAPPKEVAVAPGALSDYAGHYPLMPSFVLTITVSEGGLLAQATGQSSFPIFSSAQDEFFAKVADIRISFRRDASGKVDGLVLHQGGRDIPAKKTD